MRTTIGALALVALVALTGCATAAPSMPEASDTIAPTDSVLDGEWRLVSATDATGKFDLKSSITTITLTGENTGGQTPCNSYGAEVAIGAGHDLTVTPGAQTKMACVDTALATIETRYLTALGLVIRDDIVDGQLVLSNEDEKITLTFDAAPIIDTEALIGTNWQLESVLTRTTDDVVPADAIGAGSILFSDETFEANGGCGEITGSWTIAGGVLLTTDVVSDTTGCAKAELPQAKVAALVLGGSSTITVEDSALTLNSLGTTSGLLFRSSNN